MIVQRLLSGVFGRVVATGGRMVVVYGNFTGTINMGDRIDQSRKQLERERLLEKVRKLVEEPLKGQLGTPIPVGLQYCPDAVPRTSIGASSETGPLPAGATIWQVFRDQEQKLLILGEGGSGKATLLRQVALDLADEAKKDERLPIPLLVSLGSWGRKHGRLSDWLVDELSQAGPYDQNRERATTWIEQEQFLPLLLGMDQVELERRDDCVQAINQFHESRKWVREMAVACRTDDYEALRPKQINLQCAVLICPLTDEQIDAYLAGLGLDVLREAVKEDTRLREMAASPLTLSFMASVFADQHEVPAGNSAEERHERLVAAYVDNRFSKAELDPPYTRDQMSGWLGWLATRLREHGQTAFYIDRLQPDWLPSPTALRWYAVVDRLGTGALVACLLGLLFGLHFALGSVPELTWVGAIVGALVGGLLGGQGEGITGSGRDVGRIARGALAAFAVVGTGAGLIFAFASRGTNLVALAVVVGALMGALAGGLAGGPSLRARPITLLGPLGWSPKLALRHAAGGLVIGAAFGAIFGLIGVFAGFVVLPDRADGDRMASALMAVALTGLLFGSLMAVAFGLLGGLVAGLVEEAVVPNQAIRRSARRAALVFGWGGLVSGAMLGALFVFIGGSPDPIVNIPFAVQAALLIGPLVGLIAALAFGGYACLSHFALRLVLWRCGVLPLKCIGFLEYAKRLELMVRVGGGYEFRPGLLAHFAGEISPLPSH